MVDALVESLGTRARGTTPEQEVDRFDALWQAAVSDSGHPKPSAVPQSRPSPVAPPAPPRRSTSIVDAAASRREASEPHLSLYMSLALFDELQDSPWQERIEDGYLRFLTGAFRPPKPKHQLPREDMTIVAARVDPQLRAAVADYARLHASDLGWIPTPKQVAVAWLMHTSPPSAGKLVMAR
ncbi:hypothetical protein [Streptomyces sp. NPDC017529]|uniref:hypothetical protein n=1 Tax=Streptomyces sp. NPDC017529 TaxID=3365000 RepID=UPI0037B6B0D7